MTSSKDSSCDHSGEPEAVEIVSAGSSGPLVVRSSHGPVSNYREYIEILREDFFYLCAYCTLMEAEAQGIRFEIDHYEPVSARPELKNDYNNLMYSCEICNGRKSDRYPPLNARVNAASTTFYVVTRGFIDFRRK